MATNDSRRRGDALEHDIFAATYALLQEQDYQQITFSQVAARAHTSRSVIYRYWDSVLDLVIQTILYEIEVTPSVLNQDDFDMGSLRADLIALATTFAQATQTGPNQYFRIVFLSAVRQDQRRELQRMMDCVRAGNLAIMDQLIQRAVQRGELVRVPNQTARMVLFDMLRYYDMTYGVAAIDGDRIHHLVDDIVMPALRNG
ncbi:TetR-like C-terminal domain-containing protein [Lacticaseibacillus pabuli]|uniref:TetR-like C-terminal domain-containing protein n=1 Tax=Lacticaseibacillus pabuli TaxID=3025672 RepID=A0ABY7WTX4_9LACO|nr:TetR-like C-terminal domain-containing protein [Lacticaseibacillus sp. KACC 23028]WDF83566.1 TetR-like C-terminal domain-containing protein [Lacticaseibacillus sp. KACC 23028]